VQSEELVCPKAKCEMIMKAKKIVFIHTVSSLPALFTALSKELLPANIQVMHIVDEILLNLVISQNGLSPSIHRRVVEHVCAAENADADIVQITCSSISPCVETARNMANIPVLKIDEAMINHALSIGNRIGVIATLSSTLGPTTDLIRQLAKSFRKQVKVNSFLCVGAYDAINKGDLIAHDNIIRENLLKLVPSNDVVLLAQASMARVMDTIPNAELHIPVLSSPRLALERLREILFR
jgi:Asp/Glu/hydantoin racemase